MEDEDEGQEGGQDGGQDEGEEHLGWWRSEVTVVNDANGARSPRTDDWG